MPRMTVEAQAPHEGGLDRELLEAIGGTWSLNPRNWRVRWCEATRLIHDTHDHPSPTVWEALEFLDPADRADLLALALRCALGGQPFSLEVGLTTARGVRKRVQITGYPGPPDRPQELMHGTISVRASAPDAVPPTCGVEGSALEQSLRDWEFFGRALPHELRGQLATIRGFAQALLGQEQFRAGPGPAQLGRIVEAGRQMDSLLEGVLQFAPLATREPRREALSLSALAQDCIEALRAAEPDHPVLASVEPGLVACADPDLMRLVLRNLLANAWKFTRGAARPQVSFRARPHEGGAAFEVSDNGTGFDMAQSHRLFMPFQRLHAGSPFGGTGLGLAIVRRAVERHGGSVGASSVPGEGASFWFRLG